MKDRMRNAYGKVTMYTMINNYAQGNFTNYNIEHSYPPLYLRNTLFENYLQIT